MIKSKFKTYMRNISLGKPAHFEELSKQFSLKLAEKLDRNEIDLEAALGMIVAFNVASAANDEKRMLYIINKFLS